jgi:hypothetical protein
MRKTDLLARFFARAHGPGRTPPKTLRQCHATYVRHIPVLHCASAFKGGWSRRASYTSCKRTGILRTRRAAPPTANPAASTCKACMPTHILPLSTHIALGPTSCSKHLELVVAQGLIRAFSVLQHQRVHCPVADLGAAATEGVAVSAIATRGTPDGLYARGARAASPGETESSEPNRVARTSRPAGLCAHACVSTPYLWRQSKAVSWIQKRCQSDFWELDVRSRTRTVRQPPAGAVNVKLTSGTCTCKQQRPSRRTHTPKPKWPVPGWADAAYLAIALADPDLDDALRREHTRPPVQLDATVALECCTVRLCGGHANVHSHTLKGLCGCHASMLRRFRGSMSAAPAGRPYPRKSRDPTCTPHRHIAKSLKPKEFVLTRNCWPTRFYVRHHHMLRTC